MANNVVIMYIRLAIVTAANFVAVRIVLQALGAEDFGTYAAVAAAVGLPAFFSGALQGAARRFLCVVRRKTVAGVEWAYVVNTTGEPRTASVELPAGMKDVVGGGAAGGHMTIALAPWELRAYKYGR